MPDAKDFSYLGTVSHGTMRSKDLIPEFSYTLRALDTDGEYADLCDEADNLDSFESEQADYVLSDLFDALDSFAPDGYYFGSHPGDGSDYGYWEVEQD